METREIDKLDEFEYNLDWNMLSTLLTNTSEKVHMTLVEPIVIETQHSDDEKLEITEIWEFFPEGIITFKIKGSDEEFDLSDYPDLVTKIYDDLLEKLSN